MATREEQERKTYIIRVWGKDNNEDLWIDLEVMEQTLFDGVQFPGLDYGNQGLQTILRLQKSKDGADTRETTDVRVIMVPHDEDSYIDLKAIDYMEVQTKNNEKLERFFNNSQPETTPKGGKVGNESRDNILVRIASNGVDDNFLAKDKDRGDGLQPPADPVKYLKAVKKSDNPEDLWLDISVVTDFKMDRGSTFGAQEIAWEDLESGDEEKGLVFKMPGIEESPKSVKKHVTLDPYQTVINFGGGGLAVEFGDKAGGPPESKDKKQ